MTESRPITPEALQEQIALVRVARAHQTLTAAHLKAQRDVWEVENAKLLADAKQAAEDLSREESKLRQLALKSYLQDGNKKPAEGLGIRIGTALVYDETATKAWAMKTMPGFLQLDRPGFEAWAKQVLKRGPIEGLTVEQIEKPTATIAKDL